MTNGFLNAILRFRQITNEYQDFETLINLRKAEMKRIDDLLASGELDRRQAELE